MRDYAPLEADVDRLTEVLSELGLVVDGVERVGEGLEDVVVARILEIRKHPNADRIRLVDVDPGDGGPLQIACGAWNFSVGDLVPLAQVGAVLPSGVKISRQKMRGEVSNGMLCSPSEIGVPDPPGASDGLYILPPDCAPPGTPIAEALGLTADVVFDLDVTPNRPDALCIAGIARDLAAALGETWTPPAAIDVPVTDSLGRASVQVDAGDLCPRFTATILEGVPDGPSPAWLARRLTLTGMRPISVVVDVSNYVMLDVGQPNHAYDLDRLEGGGILVRRGGSGETVETLDGIERTVGPDDCVICDAQGAPVGIGGIMGASRAEIGPETTRVLLEAAWFTPMAVARTGKRLGLHSEARMRFERGIDPEVATVAAARFISLLAALPGGERLRRGPLVDVRDRASLPEAPVIELATDRVNSLLGTELSDHDVSGLLTPIGFACHFGSPGVATVTVPTWRLECARPIDLIEEVARMWGYRRIRRTIPAGARQNAAGLNARQRERRRIRQVLQGAGYCEAWTTTFLGPGDLERAGLSAQASQAVEVQNPLDKSESILRTSLLPGLLKALKFNTDRQATDVYLFETGRVFASPNGDRVTPEEEERLGVVVLADPSESDSTAAVGAAVRTWGWLEEGLRVAGAKLTGSPVDGLHPTRSARLVSPEGDEIGVVGEVDAAITTAYGLTGRVGYLDLSLDRLLVQPRIARLARDVSRYPSSDIDLALVVGEDVAATDVRASLMAAGGASLESVSLFDVFRDERLGAGRRSLAFRLRFRAMDRTLTDSDLAGLRQSAIDRVAADHGAELRG
jgi:phenylalanyl-tRNA synthetase beta chain